MVRIFEPCVYIVASRRNGTIYTGVTSNLIQRLHQHRTGTCPGFTAEHDCHRLVWFERHDTMETAIQREKRIKKWNRDWKQNLVEQDNPHWHDLASGLGFSAVPQ
ncbi:MULTISPECIES: GIY-YIG nuclease family protein [unclassified Sphingomonas]|uniref:GIY-YIG nuclease family protein n=1 Tax=unclassified Sphingomonas TaxID=196159 RepID=UPI0006FB7EB7|nr:MULTISPECIES: GIY-YIG nuclease family protein [unclassified Sphingomonas]KQM26634.1 endonuclease [Sphingomonas sp. Leaf9]KQM43040.1 endonuclease [Sphingomonas sp. Leaf11]